MTELRIAAEALLQTAQIHQRNFETITAELQISRQDLENLRQQQIESDRRFEIMLAEFRQLKIESEIRFNGMQTEIRRLIDRLFNQQDDTSSNQ